jgi:hypothetical protein
MIGNYVEVVLQLMMEGTMDVLKLVRVVSCVCCVDVIIVLDDGIVDVVVVEYVTLVPVEGDSGERVVLVMEAELDWVYSESSDSLIRA